MRAHGGLSNMLPDVPAHNTQRRLAPEDLHISGTREAKFSSPPSSVQSMLWPTYHCNLANSTWQSLSRRAVRQTAKPTLLNPIGAYSRTGVRGRLDNLVQECLLPLDWPICTMVRLSPVWSWLAGKSIKNSLPKNLDLLYKRRRPNLYMK